MVRYIQKPNGKMAGSIGDGRDNVPSQTTQTTTPNVTNTPLGSLALAARSFEGRDETRIIERMNSLADVHLRPAGPYPGSTKKPWTMVCVTCEEKGCTCNKRKTFTPVANNILRGQRINCCCYVTKNISHDDATAMLNEHLPGWTAYEPFPGSFTKRWIIQCNHCGAQNISTLQAIRSYAQKPVCWWCSPRDVSAHFLQLVDENYNVSITQAIVTAPHEPWHATCNTCGDNIVLRYDQVQAGMAQQCACNPRVGLTDEQARAAILNYFPSTVFNEPYPGDRKLLWNMTCTICHTPVAVSLRSVIGNNTKYTTLGCQCRNAGRSVHDEERLRDDIAKKHPQVTIISVTNTGPEAVVRMVCPQGHDTRDLARTVKQVKQGCRDCRSSGGYDPHQAGYLYVISGLIDGRPALKFGITNYPQERLATHERTGLDTIVTMHRFTDGSLAPHIEKQCKELRRTLSIPTCRDDGASFDGYTETVFIDTPQAQGFISHVETLVGSYSSQADIEPVAA